MRGCESRFIVDSQQILYRS
ncbi:hypothetical protein Anas_11003 [Armadillidium nasatum]|uniref:Uncharacterized protein n=1 Tax=Armadillidium nasatum TaxID=96803 RepID=A0A5N5SLL3_9CRUS|nr:hypothetical protein Anas_11003 [Armadillidium nasatum]